MQHVIQFWDDLPSGVRTLVGGSVTAALSGGVGMLGSIALDPDHFNLQQMKHLGIVFGVGALLGLINWLRQSPWQRV